MASILVGKQKFNKGTFIYFIFLSAIGFEKSVLGDNPDDCCKLVLIFNLDLLRVSPCTECSFERGSENNFKRM